MVFSNLASEHRISTQSSSREGAKIESIILHHMASTNAPAVINMMVTGSRRVSSNYVVSNEGKITGVVPEELRAWTSGSKSDGGRGAAWDRKSITFEIANSSAGGAWPVSAKAQEATAQVVADVAKRYGIILNRDTVIGHRELWTRHRASYPTACPGGLDMDWIVNRANQILSESGNTPAPEPAKPVPTNDLDEIARQVIAGLWGNGPTRVTRLVKAGYNPDLVQKRVNEILSGKTPAKPASPAPAPVNTIDKIAREVIAGNWGNGPSRTAALKKAGYDPRAVQNRVNQILSGKASTPVAVPVPTSPPVDVVDKVAREVIRGDWGNGPARTSRLKKAGYDPRAIQNRVNQILSRR